jgi:hypothetical protein
VLLLDGIAGVAQGGGDHIGAAGPLPKVKQTASLAAEGKVGVGSFYLLLAGRALKLNGAFARHTVEVTIASLAGPVIRFELAGRNRVLR